MSENGGGAQSVLAVPLQVVGGLKDAVVRHPAPVAGGILAIVWPFFAANYWIFTVSAGIILAIAALGLMVIVGWAREVSLMQAALVGTACYWMGYLYRPEANDGKGYNFILAAALGIGLVVLVSAVASLATLRLSGIYIMVLTLALQFTIERTWFAERKLTGGLTPLFTPRPKLFGINIENDIRFYFFCLGVLGLCMVGLHRLRNSRYGRSLLLVGANRQAAASVGISPWRYKLFAFCIGGFMAGVAGVLAAPLYNSPPNALQFFAFQSLFYLAVPVVAGFESMTAVVAVAITFILVPQALETFSIDALVLGGAGLILGTLAGPRGLGGVMKDVSQGLARRRKKEVSLESEGTPAYAGRG